MSREDTNAQNEEGVPFRALLLSVGALLIPVTASIAFPDLASEDFSLLIWLSALVPPFLLAFYRGWGGASVALAAGMAALAFTQVVLSLRHASSPPPVSLLLVVIALIGVSLGAGWLSDRLHVARRTAEKIALTDGLTGLANRRHLSLFLESAFAATDRGMPLSVVIFDLDNFKRVNDEYGHAEGDRVINRLAEILAQRTRDMNLSGRWGGEEFLSILNGTELEGARIFAEHVRRALEDQSFAWGKVTVSAGVASHTSGMKSPELLVAAADHALYSAKEEGRNRVRVSEPKGSAGQVGGAVVAGPEGAERAPGASEPDEDTEAAARVDPGRATQLAERGAGDGEEDGPPPRGDGEVVLVVVDDDDARHSLGRALSRFGYRTLECSSPEEAIEVARGFDESIDLVVTDVIMPSMSGFRLVEILLSTLPTLRVVYVSGYPQEGVEWEGAPGLVSQFLNKPVRVETLVRAAHEVLHRTPSRAFPDALDEATRAVREEEPPSVTERAPAGLSRSAREVVEARILIVDDEESVARTLSLMLGRMGFVHVRATTDPADLPVLLAKYRPDLVLLDLHLPGIDGIEIMEAIGPVQEEHDFLPVIAVTGDTSADLRRRALEAGAADFVAKPLDAVELEPRVRNLVRIRIMTRHLSDQARALESRVAARTAELAQVRTEVLRRLGRAAEYRDDATGRHAERVGALAGLLAESLGVESKERDMIARTAPLHDLGKIAVSDAILRKPGPLTPEERLEMETHAERGAELLGGSSLPLLGMAREIALHHHERWNGTGYPHGLREEDISLPSRIVAIADVYDSMIHDRPYRPAHSEEEAVAHITEQAGVLYDEAVVSALLDLRRMGRIAERAVVEVIRGPADGTEEPDRPLS